MLAVLMTMKSGSRSWRMAQRFVYRLNLWLNDRWQFLYSILERETSFFFHSFCCVVYFWTDGKNSVRSLASKISAAIVSAATIAAPFGWQEDLWSIDNFLLYLTEQSQCVVKFQNACVSAWRTAAVVSFTSRLPGCGATVFSFKFSLETDQFSQLVSYNPSPPMMLILGRSSRSRRFFCYISDDCEDDA